MATEQVRKEQDASREPDIPMNEAREPTDGSGPVRHGQPVTNRSEEPLAGIQSGLASNLAWKRRLRGGALGFVGFMLSPLSWWNDLFINIPLALGLAWLVAWAWPAAFEASFIVGYWLTNVIGLVLLSRGAKELMSGQPSPYARRELAKDVLIALFYTGLIVLLLKLKVLQPVRAYVP